MSSEIDTYEKLGAFYLGREVDPETGTVSKAPLLYDSKDLTTHAVCLGMTGAGKTGLCIALLEEAAIDGIPSIVLDPKGDLGNLLLTFPELSAEEFRPWVDETEAARKGIDAETFAARQAELWRRGLADWDQDGERIRRLRDAVDMAIYTPGSEAGLSLSILSSFQAPPPEILDEADLLQERITTTVGGLLSLLGIETDPIRSRETILLANLLEHAWKEGKDMDLPSIIRGVQKPPFDEIGIMPLDSFYPEDERFELAMTFNNLLASPSFESWRQGEPLDVDRLLYTAEGKPRMSILSIAHLSETERMFFVSLVLGQVVDWMRSRAGTSSLRAILYMDEVYGYLPPVANPPSKRPLLTLLKQARAFGLGLVLATQNPVDLDYKALSNIGTWLLGRLQTERDQKRVMDGLLSAGSGLSRKTLETLLAGLEKRVFLLHDVHEPAPVLLRVRWVLSYLRGPLTREHIRRLMAERKAQIAAQAQPTGALEADSGNPQTPRASRASAPSTGERERDDDGLESRQPIVPSGVRQRFVHPREDGPLVYRPRIVGLAQVHFVDRRRGLEAEEEVAFACRIEGDDLEWRRAELLQLLDDDFESEPAAGIAFADLPAPAAKPKNYRTWKKDLSEMLYRERRWSLWKSAMTGLVSEPGESEREFRIRVRERAREERDEAVEKVRASYARKEKALEQKILRQQQRVEKERAQARDSRLQSMVRVGTTFLGAFLGRKTLSRTNLNRAGSAVRGVGKSFREGQDVELAEDLLAELQSQDLDLEAELVAELEAIRTEHDTSSESFDTFELRPRRVDVDVRQVILAWLPYRSDGGRNEPGW